MFNLRHSAGGARRSEEEEEEREKKEKNTGVGLGFYFIVLSFISLATPTVCAVMMLPLSSRRRRPNTTPSRPHRTHPPLETGPIRKERGAWGGRKQEAAAEVQQKVTGAATVAVVTQRAVKN